MRSLVPIVSFIVLSLSATAQSKPSQAPAATAPKITSLTIINSDGSVESGKSAEQKLLSSAKVRAAMRRALMEEQARMHACFTLDTYAPLGQKASLHPGATEKPYARQTFALRSTCSAAAKIEQLPASRPVKPNK